ncbi:MAG TPA: glycogen debranching N-terminal domain-containing protein [Acidimicrobiales bacterium]|nr:glycogen debranching N-terminal domain-containing protein [Acidimicrobiales bacterium]
MTQPWTFAGSVPRLGSSGGTVTLVDESTFAISASDGDVVAPSADGLFVRDTRILSRFELRVNGARPEALAVVSDDPFSASFVSRCPPRPGRADSTLMVFRRRYVGQGMREDVVIRNFGDEATFCLVEMFIDSDFADLFAVKEGRVAESDGEITRDRRDGYLELAYRRGSVSRGTAVHFSPTPMRVADDLVSFEAIVPAHGEWSGCVEVHPVIEGEVIDPRYLCGQPVDHAAPAERLAKWRRQVPQVETDHEALGNAIECSAEDLGALRIFDPDFPERVVVAAGAPWFMTVFGRDSLITSWMALLVDPDLALGVLQTLARFQGENIDPRSDEQPGRILHEMRFGDAPSLSLGGGNIYYGTADATPLFVMLMGELRRWGLAREVVDELMPNVERALEWIEGFGDSDGDGYVEYQRMTDRGLANQGWKDSGDGIRYADGRVAHAPIALCEVQAYVYGAYLARAHFAREAGDEATFERFRAKATTLKEDFNRDFWLEDRGWFAVGLDGDKRPIDSLTSNMGHCLWAGIIDEDKARIVADKLLSPEMFSGWGVRTLATSMGGFNPMSYHCGSVWPHDTALVAAGLARYGFVDHSLRLVTALLDVALELGGRLPELFCGLDRAEFSSPVAYPTSCSPQAWAAASPLLCLRIMLRLDPWIPYGKTWLAPALPEGIKRLKVEGIPLAGSRVSVEVEGDDVEISGLPPDIELITEPREPATHVGDAPAA